MKKISQLLFIFLIFSYANISYAATAEGVIIKISTFAGEFNLGNQRYKVKEGLKAKLQDSKNHYIDFKDIAEGNFIYIEFKKQGSGLPVVTKLVFIPV